MRGADLEQIIRATEQSERPMFVIRTWNVETVQLIGGKVFLKGLFEY